jgi:hypothetical protein
MLLESLVHVLRDGDIDNSSTAPIFPDTKLKGANGVDRFGNTYRTVRQAGHLEDPHPKSIAVPVFCLLVSVGSSSLGRMRHFMVLGGLSSPPGAFELIGFLSAVEHGHPGWYKRWRGKKFLYSNTEGLIM